MQICRCCPIPETGQWVTSCISIGPYANAIHDKGPITWKDAPVFFFPLGFYSEARRQMKWLLDRVHLPALLWVYGAVGGIPVCRPFLKFIYFFIFFSPTQATQAWLSSVAYRKKVEVREECVCNLCWTDDPSRVDNWLFPLWMLR